MRVQWKSLQECKKRWKRLPRHTLRMWNRYSGLPFFHDRKSKARRLAAHTAKNALNLMRSRLRYFKNLQLLREMFPNVSHCKITIGDDAVWQFSGGKTSARKATESQKILSKTSQHDPQGSTQLYQSRIRPPSKSR